jgi:dipeptidyl aminopeptidase/acylaminoacyl peptidase
VRDISDILLALDTCLSMGIGSEGSLGVLGGSYGGCLSLQLIAHQPSRFSCCTARNPVRKHTNSLTLTLTHPFMCWLSVHASLG